MSYNQKGFQGNWFIFNYVLLPSLVKEAIAIMYKARTFAIFKQPDLQRIPASDKELQICSLNYSSQTSTSPTTAVIIHTLLGVMQCHSFCQLPQDQEEAGKLCCVIVLDKVKPKLMYSFSRWGLLACLPDWLISRAFQSVNGKGTGLLHGYQETGES